MRLQPTPTFLVLALLAACQTAPPGPPEEVAAQIVEALDTDRPAAASDLFDRVANETEHREKIYPVLFEAARERWEAGATRDSVALLRFLAEHYPEGRAVREALLYGLMIERARQQTPDPELVEEMQDNLDYLREKPVDAPEWIDLIEVWVLIDRGRVTEAREVFGHFLATWEGSPPSLMLNVEDLDRYLKSH